jgi:hypothetical protein
MDVIALCLQSSIDYDHRMKTDNSSSSIISASEGPMDKVSRIPFYLALSSPRHVFQYLDKLFIQR